MTTITELRELAARLNAELNETKNGCISISMPLTKQQDKANLSNDFLVTFDIDAVFKFATEWETYWRLKSLISNKMIKEYVRDRLGTDDKMAQKALLKIFEYQTLDEQRSEHTSENNNVGFSGTDAPFLSSLAKQVIERKGYDPNRRSGLYLSRNQFKSMKRLIKKYWKQIVIVMVKERANELKLLKLVAKANSITI